MTRRNDEGALLSTGSYHDSRIRRSRRSPSYSSESDYDRRRKDATRERGSPSPEIYPTSLRNEDWRKVYSKSPDRRARPRKSSGRNRRISSPERRRSESPRDSSRHRRDNDREYRSSRRQPDYDEQERPSKRRRSTSPHPPPRHRTKHSRSPSPNTSKQSKAPLPPQKEAFNNESTIISKTSPPPEKQKPNFSNTGRLAAESNSVTLDRGTSIVLKYHEPPEARKPPPKDAWRLYVFKGPDILETIELGTRSCWLFGRERMVVDFPVDHPSCSKQHAVIQFRYVEKKNEFGDKDGKVRPYVIDLESANGTMVNGDKVPGGRYLELRDKDVMKFGLSTREYVLMLP